MCLNSSSGWRDPILSFLKDGTLLEDKAEAHGCNILTPGTYFFGNSYTRNHTTGLHYDSYLRCLGPEQARSVMQKSHDGDCGNHAGGRSLADKAINQGYYWSKMFGDAKNYVKKCPQCQRFAPASNRLSTDLHTLRSSWPSCNRSWK